MHSRLIDLARYGVAWREDADDGLSAARGIVWATIGSTVFWLLVWAALT